MVTIQAWTITRWIFMHRTKSYGSQTLFADGQGCQTKQSWQHNKCLIYGVSQLWLSLHMQRYYRWNGQKGGKAPGLTEWVKRLKRACDSTGDKARDEVGMWVSSRNKVKKWESDCREHELQVLKYSKDGYRLCCLGNMLLSSKPCYFPQYSVMSTKPRNDQARDL